MMNELTIRVGNVRVQAVRIEDLLFYVQRDRVDREARRIRPSRRAQREEVIAGGDKQNLLWSN